MLLRFESVSFTEFTFDQVTFAGNRGCIYADNPAAPEPILFSITSAMFANPDIRLNINELSL